MLTISWFILMMSCLGIQHCFLLFNLQHSKYCGVRFCLLTYSCLIMCIFHFWFLLTISWFVLTMPCLGIQHAYLIGLLLFNPQYIKYWGVGFCLLSYSCLILMSVFSFDWFLLTISWFVLLGWVQTTASEHKMWTYQPANCGNFILQVHFYSLTNGY